MGINKPFLSELAVVILRNHSNFYGIVVDEFIGEKELVIQDIKSHIGKIPCIAAGSVLQNGDPVLIIDIEDITSVIDKIISKGELVKMKSKLEFPCPLKSAF